MTALMRYLKDFKNFETEKYPATRSCINCEAGKDKGRYLVIGANR
jgi:hypothetical protein